MTPTFRCPHDRLPLAEAPGGLACAGGHRFDRAREGYVHLLPAGRKAGRAPGDDEAMVRARRAVFDAGLYRPVMEAVAEAVAGGGPVAHVLDAGCGEGSYLAAVVARTGATGWGIDVSKPAIRLAARRHRDSRFAVASSYVAPFDDAVVDAALTVFAPRHFPELFRVVRPGGVVVVASPGPDHLSGLKAQLYATPRRHDVRAHVSGDGGPEPEWRERVRFELSLPPAHAVGVLQMTPYWWHATAEQQDAVAHRHLHTVVDVWVTRHRRP